MELSLLWDIDLKKTTLQCFIKLIIFVRSSYKIKTINEHTNVYKLLNQASLLIYVYLHKITFCLKRMNKNIFQCPTINKNQATNATCVILMQYSKCDATIIVYHLLSIQTCEATITYFKYETTNTNVSLSFIIHSMKKGENLCYKWTKKSTHGNPINAPLYIIGEGWLQHMFAN